MSTRGREAGRAPLRVRKRNRTRRDLQRAAIDLVEANGYPATSVDEICDRAEVSRSTFFRYFGSKDAVFGSDILEEELIALLDAPGPPSLADLENRICAGLAALPAADWEIERRRMHLLRTVPELRPILVSEAFRPFPPARRYVARMLGLPVDSLRVRTVAGAVIGALAAQQVPDAEGEYELPASAQDAIARYRATFRELEQILDPARGLAG